MSRGVLCRPQGNTKRNNEFLYEQTQGPFVPGTILVAWILGTSRYLRRPRIDCKKKNNKPTNIYFINLCHWHCWLRFRRRCGGVIFNFSDTAVSYAQTGTSQNRRRHLFHLDHFEHRSTTTSRQFSSPRRRFCAVNTRAARPIIICISIIAPR